MFADFAEWMPDLPAHRNPGSTVATNVIPRTSKSYGPMPGLSVYSNALTDRCRGAFAARQSGGTVTNFAGDSSKLYTLSAATWSAVNTGLTATAAEDRWAFCQMGERVLATNFADVIKTWTLGSSTTFATLAAAAPRARHIAVVDPGFLMVGNTYDATDLGRPGRVWWSALGDPTSWPTPGTAAAAAAQSDYNDMPAGGWVNGITGAVGGAQGAVFMDTSIFRIQYQGPPDVFGFYEVERGRGTPAPGSIVNVGPFAAYLGEDGFYVFDGARSEPIGRDKIDKTFFASLDQTYFHRITSCADPINKVLMWSVPVSGHSSGNANRIFIYNWSIGRWSVAEVENELIYSSLTTGYTLDGLDSYSTNLDALPFSLDSRAWTGGRLLLSAFNTDHKLCTFTGSNLAATIETGELSGDNGRRLRIRGARPVIDGGTVTATVGYRETPSASVTYDSATSIGNNGVCPMNRSTRYARIRASVAAAGSWTHANGMEIDAVPVGRQ